MCPNLNTKGGRTINRRSRLKLLAAGVGAPLVAPKRSEAALTKATISPVKCWAHPSMNRSFSQSGMLVISETRAREDPGATEEANRSGSGRPAARERSEGELLANAKRRDEFDAQLRIADEQPPLLHPSMADVYRTKVEQLTSAVQRDDSRIEAFETLRGFIDSIVLTPDGGQLRIELRANLAAMFEGRPTKEKVAGTWATSSCWYSWLRI
jgi:hypothetical protein